MIFSDDPEQGIRRGRILEHPALGIRFEVPSGFTMINTPKELIARSDDGSVVPFDMAPGKKVRELGGMTNYIKAVNFKGGKLGNVENLNVNGMAGLPALSG